MIIRKTKDIEVIGVLEIRLKASHHKPGLPHWKIERLRAHADHERAVLACMRSDAARGELVDPERAAKAKERLRKIGGLLND